MIKNFLNPEGHQNPICGSKVTTILLKGWILPLGGALSGEGLRLQPAQQACLFSGCGGSVGYSCCGSGGRVLMGVVALWLW